MLIDLHKDKHTGTGKHLRMKGSEPSRANGFSVRAHESFASPALCVSTASKMVKPNLGGGGGGGGGKTRKNQSYRGVTWDRVKQVWWECERCRGVCMQHMYDLCVCNLGAACMRRNLLMACRLDPSPSPPISPPT